MNIKKMLSKILPEQKVLTNVSLREFNTMRIDAKAKTLIMIDSKKELLDVLNTFHKNKINYLILGNGSNVVFKRKQIKKPILLIKGKGNSFYEKRNGYIVTAFAGCNLSVLVIKSQQKGATGLEWAVGIPGSVGGAVVQNAGAYGSSMADIVKEVVCYQNGVLKTLHVSQCGFQYRKSALNTCVVVEVKLYLPKGDKKTISDTINKNHLLRIAKTPKAYSAGSVFKNVDRPSGYLIEQCGLKGYCIGDACVSDLHANMIINKGNASGKDVYKLIKYIQKVVYNKYKIMLEPEVKIIR